MAAEANKKHCMSKLDAGIIARQMQDAQDRTLVMLRGLSPDQLIGPKLATVNPMRWEIGHAAYFYEYWVLRQHLKNAPLRADVDALYDSINIAHEDRWDLPLPPMKETLEYIQQVIAKVSDALTSGDDSQRDYLAQYAVFHQDMHNEAYTYTRQTHNYPTPEIGKPEAQILNAGSLAGDADIPGGAFMLGANKDDGFVFDNEKWAHPVKLKPFSIAKAAVSNLEYLKFVEADGYQQRDYWDDAGWEWLQQANLQHPLYWQNQGGGWQIKQFDQWVAMPMSAAIIHVCWHEAQAWCRWADRRLPTETEWEAAAAAEPSADGRSLSATKRKFPWGDTAPKPDQANLDGYALGTVDVAAHAAGDSAFGCRQMIGNVWEWTQDTFNPYPQFEPDMYADYSQPLFGTTKVLRGGAWPTRGRMIRNTWRTYYGVDRNDVFAGFRSCAV